MRSKILPQLRKEFLKLAPVLIAEHGKDIQHAPGSNPSSSFPTPKLHPQKNTPEPKASTTTTHSSSGAVVNTTTVTDSEEFRTTADELYKTFTDPQRLAAFTRAPPKVFEGAHKGGKFELFGGNVVGEYIELDPPKRIVQSWRLQQWPAGHHSTLEIEFDQNDVDAVTVMRVNWTGVPVGQEDVTKENWQTYYVHSIKKTFGYVGITIPSPDDQLTNLQIALAPFFDDLLSRDSGYDAVHAPMRSTAMDSSPRVPAPRTVDTG